MYKPEDKRRVIISNKPYFVSKNDILTALKDAYPESVRKYYIEVNGRQFGIKQAIYTTLNISKESINSNLALMWLKKLGF